ncbi:hypothetical protein BUL40_15535 [Croceivirga radicis]|uniref:Uncharacterized protein n=1 Tax=Croceivirga radicis TaxID=1929488 RepID=A0A1V6LMZ0_9FLAO|nr:hypothetical protein [Croceivirga radicis]OQD41528.1 hypothetical protein BUL40_15535 [Croceivirga radicis]
MKIPFVATAVLCLTAFGLQAQVKIGNNPQNLDNASVLELESTSRALVITRVTTAQMNVIFPLKGALIYNTDEDCVFHYDGNQWQNLCNEENTTNVSLELVDSELILTDSDGNTVTVSLAGGINQSFSADAIENFNETITITQTGDNYNFEVKEITGDQIVDGTVNGVDLQNGSVTQIKLAPNSVGVLQMQDNAITDNEIDYNEVTLLDFDNDAGYITNANIISPDANNALSNSNGAFYDDTSLNDAITTNENAINTNTGNISTNTADIGANTAAITTNSTAVSNLQADVNQNEADADAAIAAVQADVDQNEADADAAIALKEDAANKSDNIALGTSNVLFPTQNAVKTYVDNVAGGVNTDEQQIDLFDINANQLRLSLDNDGEAPQTVDLTPYLDDQNAAEVSVNPTTDLTSTNVQAALEELQGDINGLTAAGGADGNDFTTGGTVTGENLTLTIPNQTNPIIDLSTFALDSDLTTAIAAINEVPDDTGSTSGDVLTTNGSGVYSWQTIAAGADGNDFISAGSLNVENLELTGSGAAGATINLSAFALDSDLTSAIAAIDQVPDDTGSANGDVLITDGSGGYSWQTLVSGGTTEEADGVTITGMGTNADPFTIGSITNTNISNTNGTNGQYLRIDPGTGNVIWDNLPTGTGGAVTSDGTTVTGDGVATALSVGTITDANITDVAYGKITGFPADLADGDNDTQYTAGTGLILTGTEFAVDGSTILADWSNIQNIPINLDLDSTDDFDGTWT